MNSMVSVFTDEYLLKKTKKGDTQAFEQIYKRWKKPLYMYLLHLLNYQKDDSEQVLSDVFISLYEYNKKNEINSCKSFLYTTAHNRALDLIKKKTELYPKEWYDAIDERDKWIEEKVSLKYEQKVVENYLSLLPEREKEIIYLYYYEDKSYEEIAEITGEKKNTVGTLLLQAKKRIYDVAKREWTIDIFT